MPRWTLTRSLPPALVAPLALSLDRARQAFLPTLWQTQQPAVEALARARERWRLYADPAAAREVDATAQTLLAALRAHPGPGPAGRWAARLDGLVRSTRGEVMDLPFAPAAFKRLEMALLDRFNQELGSYPAWGRRLAALVRDVPRARVMDLAAGSGGLLRHLAAHPPAGVQLDLVSTDLEPTYVAQGRAEAARAGLPVRFEVRDALDLRDLAGQVDLFVCTQSTHHFPPGRVVRMMAQAIAVAPRGILVVDVMRSAVLVAGAGLATTFTVPFPPLVLDGMQSVRRGYTPAELVLLARLAGATRVEAGFEVPGHAWVHALGAPRG